MRLRTDNDHRNAWAHRRIFTDLNVSEFGRNDILRGFLEANAESR